jgi:CDP-6-deoxy-D-xylo-4-hexulose-3-dehydrase
MKKLIDEKLDWTFSLRNIIDKESKFICQDNCESLGATYNNKYLGTYGTLGTFSFFFSHHMQTMEGGMILTDDTELEQYCRSLRSHGWIRDLPDNNVIYKKSGDPFVDSFKFVLPGYCVRPLEMSGAIGSVQLTKMDRMIDARRKNAETFTKLFGNDFNIQTENRRMKSSWFGFGVVLKEDRAGTRQMILDELKKAKVEVRPIVAGNFVNQPVLAYMKHRVAGPLPNAQMIDKDGFFFGNDWRPLKKKIVATRKLIG